MVTVRNRSELWDLADRWSTNHSSSGTKIVAVKSGLAQIAAEALKMGGGLLGR